jgi:hypothetical protein
MSEKNPVTQLISLFAPPAPSGRKERGLRALMEAIGEGSPNLIQHWEKRGRIPHYRRDQIEKGARVKGVTIPKGLLARVFATKQPARQAA